MDFKMLFVIVLVALVGVVIYALFVRKERDKYLFQCNPLKRDNQKLQEENERLMRKLGEEPSSEKKTNKKSDKKADKKSEKKGNAKQKKTATPEELNARIQSLKEDVSRLKEENYNLKRDNKSLRADMNAHTDANDTDQKVILSLKDRNEELEVSIKRLEERLKEAQSAMQKQAAVEEKAPQTTVQPREEDLAQIRALEKENGALKASLKDVRESLSSMKSNYKDEVENARRSVQNELKQAKKEAEKSRALSDSNHKVYLVARAQLALAMKRLEALDASYKLPIALPVSNDAIEELAKKIDTIDARAAATSDQSKIIDALRAKVAELEQTQSAPAAQSFSLTGLHVQGDEEAKEDLLSDDSLTSLVAQLSDSPKEADHASGVLANDSLTSLVAQLSDSSKEADHASDGLANDSLTSLVAQLSDSPKKDDAKSSSSDFSGFDFEKLDGFSL